MEGHRSQIRLRGHAAGWHYGSAHLFVTPNIADMRSSLLLQLHLQNAKVEECKIDLDWEAEMPELPSAAAMRRIVASDPVAQARCFALMMDLFCEEVLGILPPLAKGSFRVGVAATFEDGIASSLQGGVFGDIVALNGPLETQGHGSLHPHMLIILLGHDLGDRLRKLMHRVQHGELVVELQRWSRRVLEAVQRFQYDSQLALSEQLSSPTQPLPLNERQRSECGHQYESAPLVPTEPDGHELEALKLGGSVAGKVLTLTGCYASLRPKYLRRSERSAGDGLEWKKKFCEDYRRLVIQNHLGCNFFWDFFPVFFGIFFPVFWGLMVLIGICSVLQLSSLICMVLLLWLDGWMDGWLVGWLVSWLVGCLVGWLVGCLVDWLVGWCWLVVVVVVVVVVGGCGCGCGCCCCC